MKESHDIMKIGVEPLNDHPAKYSGSIVELIGEELIPKYVLTLANRPIVVDPFAGVGGIFAMTDRHEAIVAIGYEIQPRWAANHDSIVCMNWLNARPLEIDAVITSPVYGNRMSDHHNAKDDSRRLTYTHVYGEPLEEGNAGTLQWGDDYRTFHALAWDRVWSCLKSGGVFILNVSDHVRKGEVQPVTAWHKKTLLSMGFMLEEEHEVKTPRMGFGQNGRKRVDGEAVLVFRKPSDPRVGFYA